MYSNNSGLRSDVLKGNTYRKKNQSKREELIQIGIASLLLNQEEVSVKN